MAMEIKSIGRDDAKGPHKLACCGRRNSMVEPRDELRLFPDFSVFTRNKLCDRDESDMMDPPAASQGETRKVCRAL